MIQTIPLSVLEAFRLSADTAVVEPIGHGLINHTWKVNNKFIVQRVNDRVFNKPEAIADNIEKIGTYLQVHAHDYIFTYPIHNKSGTTLVYDPEFGYYRMFALIPDSHTMEVVPGADEAYEAAKQFASFTSQLQGFDVSSLSITIPNFHDLALRYHQLKEAIQTGNPERIRANEACITLIFSLVSIVETYHSIVSEGTIQKRVTHHDTKISNVLFNGSHKGICVIDLDTVMPGYFISDLGDMFRTYLSPVSEEETDCSTIGIRTDIYKAIVEGYLESMHQQLSAKELNYIFYAGKYMMYMQAIRFLTDYFNNDVYYSIRYEDHNLQRAINQLTLLQRFIEKEDDLKHYGISLG